jgi:regulator of sigma E protease
MVFLQNIWWYLVLIGVMILIHELGHYMAARLFDVKVETFSFGFGPRLFGFRHGDTDFRFSAILFGGYVKMAGDQPAEDTAADPRNLLAKPRWQRLIITLAGPAINVVLAIVLLAGLFMVHYTRIPTPRDPVVGFVIPEDGAAKAGIKEGDRVVQVDNVVHPNWEDIALKEIASARQPMQIWVMRDGQQLHVAATPSLDEKQGVGYLGWMPEMDVQVAGYVSGIDAAQRAGLVKGDILVSVNGKPLRATASLHEVMKETDGHPVVVVYARNGQQHSVTITPVKRDADGTGHERWMLGVAIEPRIEITKLPLNEALYESCRRNFQMAQLLFKFIERMAERRMSPKSLQGPIGIAQMSGDAAREGAASFFELMSGVSLQLAIFNLVPIPILDGGTILMLLIEMLLRRDLDLKVKEAVVKVGFVFLMVVVVFVIYNDISKILPPG